MAVLARKNVKTVEDLEIWLNNTRTFKVTDPNISTSSVKEILWQVGYHQVSTSYKTDTLHCRKNMYRSLLDIIRVCKYHHPKITYKTILSEITAEIDIVSKEEDVIFRGFRFCPDVNKYNFGGRSYLTYGTCRSGKGFLALVFVDMQYCFNNLGRIEVEKFLSPIVNKYN